ncbi:MULTISPECIES: sulfatase family protein [unclassified Robiginitalea]|uniref:sulfatase family protein n=1 Tax=Robiginitalea TaxID=252306 RepID=UPI002349EAFB|nr:MULTISPECIES: sulfatase [unclassified Robiginitalea]MDC6354919.1 sulfatase [Robiginitalea sp. PM2]MDC6375185.1 sulfatase [Robiginitalea sp. SP8]
MKNWFSPAVILLTAILLTGCNESAPQPGPELATWSEPVPEIPDYSSLELPEKPNILWLVAEDLSPYIAAYGDSTVHTPNLDRLAAEGVRYTRMFSPSGVCAPSRAAIALGMYPTRTGAMHMRTGPWYSTQENPPDTWYDGRKIYEAVPPAGTHMHSTLMRRAGYYATNNAKQDYQFRTELTAWDESSRDAHWRNRPSPEQPFFAIFNFEVTHESRIWMRAGDSLLIDPDREITVPPYLPDTDSVRTDLRRMYSNIVEMDRQVGIILDQLEADGLLENTVVFWYGDHGGPLPRSKRSLYDTGLQVPLLVRFPGAQLAGQTDGQLLSFVDLKPTILSLAGVEPPRGLDGRAWAGAFRAEKPREYIHAAADDFDGCCHGRLRAVRDYRFKYIRNFLPEQAYYQPVPYREQMPAMRELLRRKEQGTLDSVQLQWFATGGAGEALFDTQNDSLELRNLAGNPQYADVLEELREELSRWMQATHDLGMIDEPEYLERIWPEGSQPVTQTPVVEASSGQLILESETPGAAIGFQWVKPGQIPAAAWTPYTDPIEIQTGQELVARAHRIGFLPSQEIRWQAAE